MINNFDVIIIGKLPPPIGGVTIHVQRLVECLEKSSLTFKFINLSELSKSDFFKTLWIGKIIHLHTSSVYLRFILSCLCFIINKKLLITFHGNLKRYNFFKNLLDRLTIKLCKIPIVLNQVSYNYAVNLNPNTRLISSFFPPQKITPLSKVLLERIKKLKSSYKYVYCTNAFNVSFDRDGLEIYQISYLVKIFSNFKNKVLIISDPSGNYKKYIETKNIKVTDNIFFISSIHDFNAVIQQSNCFIRFTTTDGDSLSIKESLYLGKSVIATNVVDRPKQVILVENNVDSLISIINCLKFKSLVKFNENAFEKLEKLYYDNLLNNQ